jgi:hypothetical protein
MEIVPIIISFFEIAVGPGGAVIVLLLVLGAIYKMITSHAFPILKSYLKQNQENLENIMEEHKEDRKAFESAILGLSKRQDRFEEDLTDVRLNIQIIKERF